MNLTHVCKHTQKETDCYHLCILQLLIKSSLYLLYVVMVQLNLIMVQGDELVNMNVIICFYIMQITRFSRNSNASKESRPIPYLLLTTYR